MKISSVKFNGVLLLTLLLFSTVAGCGKWNSSPVPPANSTVPTATFTVTRSTTTTVTRTATPTSTATLVITSTRSITPTTTATLTATATATLTATATETSTSTTTPTATLAPLCNPVFANPTAPGLGAAGQFVMLSEQSLNTSPTSSVVGNLGISPNGFSSMTGWSFTAIVGNPGVGYEESAQVTGKIYSADAASDPTTVAGAIGDMLTAYNLAAGYPSNATDPGTGGNLDGLTLTRGVYAFDAGNINVTIPTALTLCGGPTDVFIFQVPGTLEVWGNIILTGGVLPKNVFWIVEGSSGATIYGGANFKGILLSGYAINCGANATITGGLYAQSDMSLISDTVTQN